MVHSQRVRNAVAGCSIDLLARYTDLMAAHFMVVASRESHEVKAPLVIFSHDRSDRPDLHSSYIPILALMSLIEHQPSTSILQISSSF